MKLCAKHNINVFTFLWKRDFWAPTKPYPHVFSPPPPPVWPATVDQDLIINAGNGFDGLWLSC